MSATIDIQIADDAKSCPLCGGRGFVPVTVAEVTVDFECPKCEGSKSKSVETAKAQPGSLHPDCSHIREWRCQTIKGPIHVMAKTALEAANNLWREHGCNAHSIALCPNAPHE